MKNLIFFDKEGNPLNFSYNENIERHEGDILFPEASSDTFKTQSLYLFEKIEPFEYENIQDLTLRKFQLFNEYGFHFYQGVDSKKVRKIEPVNQESTYYSKWIHGRNFESIFKLGTFIRFNIPIFEFTDVNRLYVVVSSKKDAILILSNLENDVFESTYGSQYNIDSNYDGVTISGIDVVGIYNYITPSLQDTLSFWNEPTFYDRLYENRKLNIVNTDRNDSFKITGRYEDVDVLTIKNPNINDIIHYEYRVSLLPVDTLLLIEYQSKTDLPLIYKGSLSFNSQFGGRLEFGLPIPALLKPGVEFKVSNSTLNPFFYKIDNIPTFTGNVNEIYYATGSQVIWNNKIYQCIQAYTWSGGGVNADLTPTDNINSELFWASPNYLPISPSSISGTIVDESLVGGEIYLTTDRLYFTQSYTQSSVVTLASAAERFKDEFNILNIDLYYSDNSLRADLVYPTNYAKVNFYHTQIGSTYSIGNEKIVYEKCIEVSERINKEFNYDISENFSYNIVFTDIDEFGIIIEINKMVYAERIARVFSGGVLDMQRTIDKTLRNWLTRHFTSLNILGVLPTLTTIGYVSVYYNSINLKTQYPNVPLDFKVKVGTTADYYIEHTVVSFSDMGNYLSINLNGRTYDQAFNVDIPTTLSNWTNIWSETIAEFGVFVSNAASSLKFDIKEQLQRVDLVINIGKSSLPGINNFNVIKRFRGNHGALITSNEILLATASESLEQIGFSTGQVIGVNSTFYPLQNIEYNSLFLDPDIINLSYEGPFWGLTDSICNSSAFTTVAFTIGFGQTGCPPSFSPSLVQGMYDNLQFSTEFSIQYSFDNNYNSFTFNGIDNMVDLIYIEPVNSIYVLGDSIRVYDSNWAGVITDINIIGLTNSVKLSYNSFSNYLFALSEEVLYKIDPYINQLIASYSLSDTAYSIELNPNNGDIYVSYVDTQKLDIFSISSNTPIILPTPFNTLSMSYNSFEQDMYVVTDGDLVLRIDGTTRTIQSTYSVIGLTGSISLDPENESIYGFGSLNPFKIKNGVVSSITSVNTGSSFNSLLFNNLNSSMNFSTDSDFSSIFVDDDSLLYVSNPIDYGNIALNQFDGDMYIAGQSGQLLVIDTDSGITKKAESFVGGSLTKIIYNPDRRSIWTIQPDTNLVIEIQVTLSSFFSLDSINITQSNDGFYGTLSDEYNRRDYLWLSVREYIRRPRENFNGNPTVSLYWKWFSDNTPQFFMYDFSGQLLTTSGPLAYIGEKPLSTIVLNSKPNRDPSKISQPEYQQTIFDIIESKLNFIDDNFDVSVTPEPIQLFLGYNSTDEGAFRSILQLYKKEDVDFTIATTLSNNDIITIETIIDEFTGDVYGKIKLKEDSSSFFTTDSFGNPRGLKVEQHLAIFVRDVTNLRNQYISNNNGYLVKIRSVFARELIVDFFKEVDRFENESSIVNDYPKNGDITYLSFRFKVWDKEIGRFNVFGQTEIEDIRYHIELNNVGKLVSSDDVYIFKEYDIKEEGIDWNYLNAKRKEMLMMKDMIYPYIGSYKSIINAINYFGYNDLELYEYYRNIDFESSDYLKLFKVEIPDIFDNTVSGWKENDFIKNTFPNNSYEDTNLFNLTYRITDKQGNNVLYYTLEEVQKKLQGLKYWLQKNIIPITHKILDITGRADFVGGVTVVHQSRDIQIINIKQDMTPIIFDLNEAYLLPVNNGSSVYNCVLDFYISDANSSLLPDNYTIDIRTYEIYREWYAFKNYQVGDRVIYFDKLYESVISNNKTNNPRKFENADDWIFGTLYQISDIVKYDRSFYVYTGQAGATSSVISPVLDQGVGFNWIEVTEWKEINLSPIEKISEWRSVENLNSFNFTIDSNISPYIVVEVTSHNGYGSVYRDRKNFDIKGTLDIQELEAFTNLTTKQYRDATQPAVYVDVSKVAELTMLALPFTSGFTYQGNPTDKPYLNQLNQVVYPNIQHGYPYVIGNSSSFAVSSFRIELLGDYIYLDNQYVISNSGNAFILGNELYWNGDLSPGSTVSVELRADVTKGGKSYWIDLPNTTNNQSLVPLTYSIISKLSTGQNFGFTQSTQGNLTVTYNKIYEQSYASSSVPSSATQSFSSMSIYSGNIIEFNLSTFSQHGIDIFTLSLIPSSPGFFGLPRFDFNGDGNVNSSDNSIYLLTFSDNNYGIVSEQFNNLLGDFGYVYYQARIDSSTWYPTLLVASYYDVSATYSAVDVVSNLSVFDTYVGLVSDTVFEFGTNSTSGSITITQSYYPS